MLPDFEFDMFDKDDDTMYAKNEGSDGFLKDSDLSIESHKVADDLDDFLKS